MLDIQVVKGNVVNMSVDALVNSSNNNLMPTGGINKMVFYSAGNGLIDACADIGYCETGKAVITGGFNSPVEYIIHTVGPYWHGGYDNEARLLASCYVEIMKLVQKHNIKSIAIPAICTGDGGYPSDEAAKIAVCTVRSFAKTHNLDVTVYFVCADNQDILTYRYLKDHFVDITTFFRRNSIKISEPLNKKEIKAATTSVFVKTLSEKKKGKLLNLLKSRLVKERLKDFIYIPYPFKKEQINEKTYEQYGVSGPFITYDCVDKILFNEKSAVFTVYPASYRFEDKERDNIISAIISDSVQETLPEKETINSEEKNKDIDIEAELESLDENNFFLNKRRNKIDEGEFVDIEKFLEDMDEENEEENEDDTEKEELKEASKVIDIDEDFNIEEIISAQKEEIKEPDVKTVTNSSGYGYLSNLPAGIYDNGKMIAEISYTINETDAPKGIKKEKNISVVCNEVQNNDVSNDLTINNEYLLGRVSFKNVNEKSKEEIAGSSFYLIHDDKTMTVSLDSDGFYYPDQSSSDTQIISDEDGNVLIKGLRFGKYIIGQNKASDGYVSDYNKFINFEIDEKCFDKDEEPVLLNLGLYSNEITETVIRYVDADSKARLMGFESEILKEGAETPVIVTDNTLSENTIKGLTVGETYIIRERTTAYGYYSNEETRFTVGNTGKPLEITIDSKRILSSIQIIQKGDVLKSVSGNNKENTSCLSFVWTTKRLPGIEYELRAAEDVVCVDGVSGVIYKAGSVVANKKSSYDGTIFFDNLPFGEYDLFITSALCGCVKPSKPLHFVIKSASAEKRVVYMSRQNIAIKMNNIGIDTNPVKGAVYGLFSGEDIYNIDHRLMAPKDTLIDVFAIKHITKNSYILKAPLGHYYLKQITPPKGYLPSDEVFNIDFTQQNEILKDNTRNVTFNFEQHNKPITLLVNTPDAEDNGSNVQELCLQIIKDGKLYGEWITDELPHTVRAIPVGHYTLKVKSAPKRFRIPLPMDVLVESSDTQFVDYEIQRVKFNLTLNTSTCDGALSDVTIEINNPNSPEKQKKHSIFSKIYSYFVNYP